MKNYFKEFRRALAIVIRDTVCIVKAFLTNPVEVVKNWKDYFL